MLSFCLNIIELILKQNTDVIKREKFGFKEKSRYIIKIRLLNYTLNLRNYIQKKEKKYYIMTQK